MMHQKSYVDVQIPDTGQTHASQIVDIRDCEVVAIRQLDANLTPSTIIRLDAADGASDDPNHVPAHSVFGPIADQSNETFTVVTTAASQYRVNYIEPARTANTGDYLRLWSDSDQSGSTATVRIYLTRYV